MIDSIAIHLPERVVDNEELAGLYPGWSADKIYEKTGIRQRHVVREGECASDLAAAAADMDGPGIFNFTLRTVPSLVADVLAKAGLRLDEVDHFVFHQANSFMLEHLRRKLGIPMERFEVCLEDCGNTVSATIPIALDAALRAGRIKPGMKILLAGFGVGFSWGGCILEWND